MINTVPTAVSTQPRDERAPVRPVQFSHPILDTPADRQRVTHSSVTTRTHSSRSCSRPAIAVTTGHRHEHNPEGVSSAPVPKLGNGSRVRQADTPAAVPTVVTTYVALVRGDTMSTQANRPNATLIGFREPHSSWRRHAARLSVGCGQSGAPGGNASCRRGAFCNGRVPCHYSTPAGSLAASILGVNTCGKS